MTISKKRIVSLLLCLAMMAALCLPALAVDEDLPDGHDEIGCCGSEHDLSDVIFDYSQMNIASEGACGCGNWVVVDTGTKCEPSSHSFLRANGQTDWCSYCEIVWYNQFLCRTCNNAWLNSSYVGWRHHVNNLCPAYGT